MASGFDLAELDSATTVDVLHKVAVIVDVDGNEKSGFFIVGKNSTEYQDAARLARIDSLKRSAKRKAALDTSTDEGAGAVAKMIEASETSLALAVVKGWFGFQQGGVDAPFSKPTVAKMLAKYPTWKDKISAALENEANFLKS